MKASRAQASGAQAFTLKSTLYVLLVVLSITGLNIFWNPPREVPPPTPEYERYFDYGFSFEHLEGMNFTTVGPDGENATENCGKLFGVMDEEDQPSEEVTVIWDLTSQEPCLEEALESAFETKELKNVSYTRGPCINSSIGDHELIYQFYNVSDSPAGEMSGVVGVWYCNLTRRSFTVQLVSPSDLTSPDELQTRFQQLMDSFLCHFYLPRRTGSSRPSFFDASDLITVSFMVFLCTGFTFTYMMDGFLNMAHTTYASIGGMASSYLVRFWGFDAYDTWPFAGFLGGVIGMFLYVVLVRPIGTRARGWNRSILLTFAFWVVAQVLGSISFTFSYWNRVVMIEYSREAALRGSYFQWFGLSASVFLGSAYCIIFVVGLYLFLTRTRFGIALRATANDENLATIMGVNTFRVHLASWFISGALSAIAGAIFAIGRGIGGGSDEFLISVMTGSIVGGLSNIYGGIIGGIFVALIQKVVNYLLINIFGIMVNVWLGLMPLLFLWLVLVLAPNGITSLRGSPLTHIDNLLVQLKRFKSEINRILRAIF